MNRIDRAVARRVVAAAYAMLQNQHEEWPSLGREILERHRDATPDEVMNWLLKLAFDYGTTLNTETMELAAELLPGYMSLFLWARSGFPHFTITPDFFHAATVTDFGDPTDEPLYMPFDAFTLSFPASPLLQGTTRSFVYKMPGGLTKQADGTETVLWSLNRITLLTAPTPIFTQWPVGMTRKELVNLETTNHPDMPGASPVGEDEATCLARLRSLLANVFTYIEASGPLPAMKRVAGSAPAPVEKVHRERPIFEVGRTVKLDGRIRQAIVESGSSHAKWTLAQRFIVRGHWRNQPYGPERSLRRRQWIEPFWKGPENIAEALSRTYEVTIGRRESGDSGSDDASHTRCKS